MTDSLKEFDPFGFEKPKEPTPKEREKAIDVYNKLKPTVKETWEKAKKTVKESGISSDTFDYLISKHAGQGDESDEITRQVAHLAGVKNEEEKE